MSNLAAGAVSAADPTLASFIPLVWWIIIIKVLVIFLFLLLWQILMIWAERRIIGRMQNRPGPNRWGPFGLLQPVADALKLPLKEDIVPRQVDKLLFTLAPILSAAPALVSFAIIPVGPEVSIFGVHTPLQLTDLPVAVLLVLAMSSVGVYGIVLAGWASEGPYSLLGALRSSAQLISYEIAMGLSFVAVFLYAGTLSTTGIVNAQAHGWYVWELLPSFLIYLITMVGETNRLPFDLPEGEGELVGGYHTEYSSLKFGLLQLAEYCNVITVSGLATTLFLGGWQAPWPISVWSGANVGWYPLIWFVLKVCLFVFFFFWLRASLPRIRYDQLMRLGWKVLIPSALAWTLMIATIRVWRRQGGSTGIYIVAGLIVAALLVLAWGWDVSAANRARQAEELAEADAEAEAEAASFPVPPMDLPHYHGVGVAPAGHTPVPSGPTEAASRKEVTGA